MNRRLIVLLTCLLASSLLPQGRSQAATCRDDLKRALVMIRKYALYTAQAIEADKSFQDTFVKWCARQKEGITFIAASSKGFTSRPAIANSLQSKRAVLLTMLFPQRLKYSSHDKYDILKMPFGPKERFTAVNSQPVLHPSRVGFKGMKQQSTAKVYKQIMDRNRVTILLADDIIFPPNLKA